MVYITILTITYICYFVCCLLFIRGDWAEYVKTLGFPNGGFPMVGLVIHFTITR